MEGDELYSHQVLASWDTVWDGIGHLALILDEAVHSPNSTRVKAIVVDLEPLQTGDARLSCVGDLGAGCVFSRVESLRCQVRKDLQVDHHWTLVRGVDGVGRVVRLSAFKSVVPLSGDLGTGGDVDDFLRHWLAIRVDPAVADDVVGVHIGNGLAVSGSMRP